MIKALPNSSVDNIVKALQKGEGITFSDFKNLTKALEEAGQSVDGLIDCIKFRSFSALKKTLGNPGEGKEWHHLVEQCQAKTTRSGFQVCDINSARNIRATPKDVHEAISKYYSEKHDFTNGKTFRDWLTGQSFDEQLKYGIEVWEREMRMAGYSL